MGARYYDASTAKFLSQDPAFLALGDGAKLRELTGKWTWEALAEPQELNSYAYARNNPMARVDRDGNSSSFAPTMNQMVAHTITWGSLAGLRVGFISIGSMLAAPVMTVAGILWPRALADDSVLLNEQAPVPGEQKQTATKAPVVTPNPGDIQGKSTETVEEKLKGSGFPEGKPSKSGDGTRYANPDVKGEQVRLMPGDPNASTPIKQGPYAVVSKGGVETHVPLEGNPTIKP